MSRAERQLNRAVRITPSADRDRYASEWRGDLSSAAGLGICPAEVARGASRIAWRLRIQRWGRTLAGEEGGVRAAAAWALVFTSVPILVLVGGPGGPLILPTAMAVAYLLARQGPARLGSIVMLAAAVLWLVCTVVFWWLWGVGFDAADANQPMPAVVQWYEPSFFVGLGAFFTFWVAFAVSVVRLKSAAARLKRTGQRVAGG